MEFDPWLTPNLNGSHFQKFVETVISNYSLFLACRASNARYVTHDFKLIVALSFRLQKSPWNGKRRNQGWPTDRIVAVRREKCTKQGKTEHKPALNNSGAWSPEPDDKTPWLQIDLKSRIIKVTRVATQGREDNVQWVTKYKLQYSNSGSNFKTYKEEGQEKVRKGVV